MGAQYGIDVLAYKTFNCQPGIYLEAGSSNPGDQNNTVFLEQNGWRGLLVEPRTIYNESYAQCRPNSILENFALVGRDHIGETVPAGESYEGHTSGLTPHHLSLGVKQWKACCLEVLLKKHNLTHIDFFSLDVEGFEHQALDGIDFNYTKFNLLVIEYHDYAWNNGKNDFSYLEKYDYIHRGEIPNGHHHIYTHKTFTNPIIFS